MIKQYVWGALYIDELLQVGLNDDPTDTEQDCESFYYALHDTHFSLIGLVDSTGNLVERYDYTPYGQRSVYFSGGTNDPECHAPTLISRRKVISSVNQPYGLNDVGFHGLLLDEDTGNIDNRHRVWHPGLGRFNQRDPLGYTDGLNTNGGYHILYGDLDPMGLMTYRDPSPRKPTFAAEKLAQAAKVRQEINRRVRDLGAKYAADQANCPCASLEELDERYATEAMALEDLHQKFANLVVAAADGIARGAGNDDDAEALLRAGITGLPITANHHRYVMSGLSRVSGHYAAQAAELDAIISGLEKAQKALEIAEKAAMLGVVKQMAMKQICKCAGGALAAYLGGEVADAAMDALGIDKDLRDMISMGKDIATLLLLRRGSCFPEGTEVATEQGPQVIEEVVIGDRVWSYNHGTKSWELCEVKDVFSRKYDGDMVELMLKADEDCEPFHLSSTDTHPFWVVRGEGLGNRPFATEHAGKDALTQQHGGRWTEARHLRLGDVFLLKSGKSATVIGLQVRRERIRVYNLTVERLHNYAVGGDGVLVHNATCHGNTANNAPATLYKKYDKDGKFLKHGVTKNVDPSRRYTQKEIDGGSVVAEERGPRCDMLAKERRRVETNPGPDNHEPWAGSKKH